jgi:hypothetical protein
MPSVCLMLWDPVLPLASLRDSGNDTDTSVSILSCKKWTCNKNYGTGLLWKLISSREAFKKPHSQHSWVLLMSTVHREKLCAHLHFIHICSTYILHIMCFSSHFPFVYSAFNYVPSVLLFTDLLNFLIFWNYLISTLFCFVERDQLAVNLSNKIFKSTCE